MKDFCESAETEYKKTLGYSNTRWLALLPAVKSIYFKNKITRQYNDYILLIIWKDITRLEKEGGIKRFDFLKHVNWLEYLEEWTVKFEDIKHFYWVT